MGLSLSVVGITVAVVQGGLIRIALKKLGKKRTIYTGMMLWAIGLFLFSVTLNGQLIYAFILPYCLGGLSWEINKALDLTGFYRVEQEIVCLLGVHLFQNYNKGKGPSYFYFFVCTHIEYYTYSQLLG